MQIYTFRHPELGIIFIKARSREEAQRAGQSALGSNLTFQASDATIADARSAAGSRLYGVRDDGALITSGTAGITNGQDNPNMVDFFTNLTTADSSLNVPPSVPIGNPPVPPDNRTFLEAFQPTAAFRSALQGTNRDVTTSPFGRTISGLQPFFETGFLVLADVASRGAEGVGRGIEGSELANQLRGPFEQFVRGTSLGQLGQLGSQAFQALSGGGGTPGEIPAGVAALRRSFTNPQSREEREQAARAGILAASQNLSPFAAFRLLPNAAELAQQAQTAQFRDPGQEFLSFLRPSLGF
jgi:hypothetical protein